MNEKALCRAGDHLLLAVSGGADSTAMLLSLAALAQRLSISLSVATLDHGLREESLEETQWVEELCRSMGVACYSGRADIEAGPGLSIENEARKVRYAFLENLARERQATHIATAHHKQDQVETLLWRWITGAPWSAQIGIPVKRGAAGGEAVGIIRPMLGCTRAEIEDYLTFLKVTPKVDGSNQNLDFLRNRLRLEVLPLLREINPQLDQTLIRQADELRVHHQMIQEICRRRLESLELNLDCGSFSVSLSFLCKEPEALRIPLLRGMLQGLGLFPVKQSHPRDLKALIHRSTARESTGVVRLSQAWDASIEGERLWIRPRKLEGSGDEEKKRKQGGEKFSALELGGKASFMGFEFKLRRFERAPGAAIRAPDIDPPFQLVWLDGKMCARDLKVRRRCPGDKIRPLGMKAGRQSLKKLFQSRGIPADRRSDIPVITCDDQIIWVVGVEIDDRFKVEEQSRTVVEIQCRTLAHGDEVQHS
ncbi:MAG: tRNA lysidine(34) synthetase TilS [Planctomycetota bacterium]|nr:tRNA lysidine(34) synthetase TilS [Planctomycetota bacterium]